MGRELASLPHVLARLTVALLMHWTTSAGCRLFAAAHCWVHVFQRRGDKLDDLAKFTRCLSVGAFPLHRCSPRLRQWWTCWWCGADAGPRHRLVSLIWRGTWSARSSQTSARIWRRSTRLCGTSSALVLYTRVAAVGLLLWLLCVGAGKASLDELAGRRLAVLTIGD